PDVADEELVDEPPVDEAHVDDAQLDDLEVDDAHLANSDLDEVVVEPDKPRTAEPEVNRLGSVPDLFDDDDETPIELPPITPSGPGPVVVVQAPVIYAPVLAETFYVPPAQRPSTTTVAAIVADGKGARGKPARKKKRSLLRTFLTVLVLFGLLAGGAFAAKKYLLHQPTWSAETKPLADDVAAARGLQFATAVEVEELPAADYGTRLATSTIGTAADSAPMWRALGVLSGELDLGAIGAQALNDAPAFYDPASKSIVVTDDLKTYQHLYRFAMHRALTAALLDQQFDWSTRVQGAAPTRALAIRATIDGDALSVANALAADDAPDQLSTEVSAFGAAHVAPVAPSQYLAAIAGRSGVAMRPTITSIGNDATALAALEQTTASGDATLDIAAQPAATAPAAGSQGMMFWYYVLASRIDDSQAWTAATRWSADSTIESSGSTSKCVESTITTADSQGALILLAALQSWALLAPAESTTTVAPADVNKITVRACDPGAALSPPPAVKAPMAFGGAGVERALVQAAVLAANGTPVDATCLVNAARGRGVALSMPADEPPVVVVGWQPPYVTANLDLASGCVAPAG
ncbi:MAG TPA: hypothetical protein VIH06_18375, partial [Ilumatobacteraceae bacterium]